MTAYRLSAGSARHNPSARTAIVSSFFKCCAFVLSIATIDFFWGKQAQSIDKILWDWILVSFIPASARNSISSASATGGNSSTQFLEPVILPVPTCGNENRPYFMDLTVSRRSNLQKNTSRTVLEDLAPYHRGYYLVTTNYPWSVVLPDSNTTMLRQKPSPFLQTTLRQAAHNRCDMVATNGGPFDKGGSWNSGPVVRNGRLIRTKANPQNSSLVGFGIAIDHQQQQYWVLGTYGQLIANFENSTRKIWNFVSGFDWLVHNSMPVASNDSDATGSDRAPRTAIGLDNRQDLLLLVIDGCELCPYRKGLTLSELADLLVELGAVYAINMDGGGSSTMVMPKHSSATDDYALVNRPTCLDLPVPVCQREVATVLCVSSRG